MSEHPTGGGGGTATLTFAEVETLHDLGTYIARAKSLDAEGAIRLQARGTVLAAWVQVLPGQGMLRAGLVLGLRVMQLDGAHDLDVTVPLGAVSDRLARRPSAGDVSATLAIPPLTVTPAWAAISPPHSGWQPSGRIADDVLLHAAREGIETVAQGTPTGAGAAAVATLRSRVWGRVLPTSDEETSAASVSGGREGVSADEATVPVGVPAGAGLAAYALGFAVAGQASPVLRSGPWTRVSLRNGEILAR
ncbi:MAG: hypothetical protein WA962_01165 [Ornithinimicrobium sp.]